jgi:hypothetical protein
MAKKIEFAFTTLEGAEAFKLWQASHLDAGPEEVFTQARLNGAVRATLGDGTTWEATKETIQ